MLTFCNCLWFDQTHNVCIPFKQPGLGRIMLFFGAHTLNGQLEDREEHFAEFDQQSVLD